MRSWCISINKRSAAKPRGTYRFSIIKYKTCFDSSPVIFSSDYKKSKTNNRNNRNKQLLCAVTRKVSNEYEKVYKVSFNCIQCSVLLFVLSNEHFVLHFTFNFVLKMTVELSKHGFKKCRIFPSICDISAVIQTFFILTVNATICYQKRRKSIGQQ